MPEISGLSFATQEEKYPFRLTRLCIAITRALIKPKPGHGGWRYQKAGALTARQENTLSLTEEAAEKGLPSA